MSNAEVSCVFLRIQTYTRRIKMSIKIIDVSHHQGIIDWNKVKQNIGGAILNCGYGDDYEEQDDKQFKRNLRECERLGIPKGVYLYSHATTDAQAQSELSHILRLIKGHKFELPIFIDVEEDGTQNYAARTCKIVCEGIKKAGFTPGVYASLYWWNTYLTGVTAYPRWVAQWGSKCTYGGSYIMWQNSETGRIDGINGAVDTNYYYGTIGAAKTTAAKTTTVKKTNSAIAVEVLAGKWGNGAERKKKLEAAGYVYNDVQKAVNELVKATSKKTNAEIAREVIAGKWGNGTDRKNRLTAAGYDYAAVQAEVNKMLR
jgi:GH25 family lysozyme M1 (1,4-beta-N-acetylmuramidase)